MQTSPIHDRPITPEPTRPIAPPTAEWKSSPITVHDILSRIDRIIDQTDHLTGASEALASIYPEKSEMGAPEDVANQARAQAVATLVTQREETNRRLLDFLTHVYDDIAPPRQSTRTPEEIHLVQSIIEAAADLPPDEAKDVLIKIIDL